MELFKLYQIIPYSENVRNSQITIFPTIYLQKILRFHKLTFWRKNNIKQLKAAQNNHICACNNEQLMIILNQMQTNQTQQQYILEQQLQMMPNWLVYPQNWYFGNEYPTIMIPTPIFHDTASKNSMLLFTLPYHSSSPQPSTKLETIVSQKTQQNSANQMNFQQKNQSSPISKTKTREIRKKKKTQLQNIKGWEKDRNILSNSLKLFLKYIRLIIKKENNFLQKIIETLSLEYNISEFESELNQFLPPSLNYIRPIAVKNILEVENRIFTSVFKIAMRKFFTQTIYLSSSKSTQIKRSIRKQQIKAGRKLLQYFFQKNIQENE